MFVSSEGYWPSTLIPPCFHLAIISATAYRNIIYAIASCNKLRDLAEVSYLVFLWSLILSDKKFMTPSCLRYFLHTSEQSIPWIISVSLWELRAEFKFSAFYFYFTETTIYTLSDCVSFFQEQVFFLPLLWQHHAACIMTGFIFLPSTSLHLLPPTPAVNFIRFYRKYAFIFLDKIKIFKNSLPSF